MPARRRKFTPKKRPASARAELARLASVQGRVDHEEREAVRRRHRRNGGHRADKLDAYDWPDPTHP